MSALGWLHTACAVAALASGAVMAVGAILVARRARTALDPFRRASGGGATRLAD